MKIGIVSDMHIGYERFEDDARSQAAEALSKAAELSDAIIIPGDVFDRRAPHPKVIADAIKIFRDAGQKSGMGAKVLQKVGGDGKMYTQLPIIAISGTHERTAIGSENALSLLGLAGLLIDTNEATTILEKDGEKVAVYGLGGTSEEFVKQKLNEINPTPTPGAFNIFMFHQSIYELLPFSDDFLRYEDLPKGFDLYVDGHIHSRVEDTVHGKPFIIPGSTVLTQLKDGEQEKKGFVLYDTSTGKHEFVPINSREFVVLRVKKDSATPDQIAEECESELKKILSNKNDRPIIRIVVEGKLAQGYSNIDLQLHSLAKKYSSRAIIDIDSSRLETPELELQIENVRDSKLEGMPLKDAGMQMLKARLKEYKYSGKLDAAKLFEMLSVDSSKEKTLKAALESLYKSYDVS